MKNIKQKNVSGKTDYIPNKEEDFDAWQQNFVKVVGNKFRDWHIPHSEYFPLISLQTDWQKTLAIAGKAHKATRTLAQVKTKKETRKEFVAALRIFVGRWISKNQHLTNTDKKNLQVTIREPSNKRPPIPETKPVCAKINNSEHLKIIIDIRDEKTPEVKKMPEKVKEIEIWGSPPFQGLTKCVQKNLSSSKYVFMGSFTSHVARLKFTEKSVGTKYFFKMRWLNSRKEYGPWSEVYNSFIQ